MSMADNRMRYGLLVLLLGPSSLQAQAPRSDSTRVPLIRTSELVGITAAIGIGFALDGTVRGDAQEDRTGTSNNLAKIGNGIGNPIYLGPALAVTWAVEPSPTTGAFGSPRKTPSPPAPLPAG